MLAILPPSPRTVLLALATLFAILSTPARAWEPVPQLSGIRVPDRVEVGGQELLLNGAGLRRILFLKVYVAALYLPERQHAAHAILERDAPRSFRVVLLKDLSTAQNIAALKGGLIANNPPEELEAVQPEVERFLGFLEGVHEVPAGTAIHLDYLPGEGTRVRVDGRTLGTVPGRAFNRALLRVWLGDDPVQASLKQALLGT